MSNRPIKEFRLGAIKAVVWAGDKAQSVQLTKSYKDSQSGEWKNTNSLFAADVPAAIFCLQEATRFLMSAPKAGGDVEPTRTVTQRQEAPPLSDDDIPF